MRSSALKSLVALACVATVMSALPRAASAQDLALTYDDLPAHDVMPAGDTRVAIIARIVAALSDAGVPPSYGFINASHAADNAHVLEIWRASGNLLGNHTWSHVNLAETTAEAFVGEIERNEPTLRALSPDADWRWFRYPYLSEGDTPAKRAAVREWLALNRYRVASMTLNFDDWAWNAPYARCVAKDDQAAIADLEASYMAAAADTLAASRRMSKTLYGREIPLMLLMHVGAFDARMAPRLLSLYRDQGMRFVTLDQAAADPFYGPDVRAESSPAPLGLEQAMTDRGLTPEHISLPANLATICQ